MAVLIILILLLLLFIKPLYHGIMDGITGDQKHRSLYDSSYLIELEELETKRYELEELITHLETLVQRDYEIGSLLDLELKKATGKQRVTLLNQITTLDNRTLKNKQKLNKLKEELQELE